MDRRLLAAAVLGAARRLLTTSRPGSASGRTRPARQRDTTPRGGDDGTTGAVRPSYAPSPDGLPDPGEVVWTWVPYEDDPAQGKDRPVLVLAVEGPTLVGLMLTSKDHDRDAADEARHGRRWMDVGTGGWDAQRRPSEVRLDRVLRLSARDVRREGAALDRARYDAVATAASRLHGW
ncbi:type II toxin-antitoxin system PemK/MazF family toxin [Cellulomonas flavigena]|uniref:type II toxin-antitoxin system PemK/MazF family toxin n=1 Tax=Cellulomonas flavigena TaxID=1711 RepID=UPI0003061978|nr:type II toxin-antitoxin system PemK/MazF family toxin [Cellulomonas flavigena]